MTTKKGSAPNADSEELREFLDDRDACGYVFGRNVVDFPHMIDLRFPWPDKPLWTPWHPSRDAANLRQRAKAHGLIVSRSEMNAAIKAACARGARLAGYDA